nr:hypothetical protein [Micromonospora sp. DSM 115978]
DPLTALGPPAALGLADGLSWPDGLSRPGDLGQVEPVGLAGSGDLDRISWAAPAAGGSGLPDQLMPNGPAVPTVTRPLGRAPP